MVCLWHCHLIPIAAFPSAMTDFMQRDLDWMRSRHLRAYDFMQDAYTHGDMIRYRKWSAIVAHWQREIDVQIEVMNLERKNHETVQW
jgi:hypothetical protein